MKTILLLSITFFPFMLGLTLTLWAAVVMVVRKGSSREQKPVQPARRRRGF